MKRVKRRVRDLAHRVVTSGTVSTDLNRYEREFVQWTADRQGVSTESALERYVQARSTVRGGFGGGEWRWLCEVNHDALRPIFGDDNPDEVIAAYRHHAPAHLLRMLSYRTPRWVGEVTERLGGRARIVDYGCGLAHGSLAVAESLQRAGVDVHLTVVDLPTIKLDFLTWMLERTQIAYTVIEGGAKPAPIDEWDLLVATEFFEHVHDPVGFFEALDRTSAPGAIMVAAIDDHAAEFMHVSPDLADLRAAVAERYDSSDELHFRRRVTRRSTR